MPDFLVCGVLLATLLAATELQAAELPLVSKTDGELFPAQLVEIDENWNFTFSEGEQQRKIAADELISWGNYRDREGKPLVVLADGGIVATNVLSVSRSRIKIEPTLWQPLDIPLELVRGIIFRPSSDVLRRDRLILRMQSSDGGQDSLLLNNGDQLTGILVEPDAEEISETFRLDSTAGVFPITRDKVQAVTFNPVLVDPPKPNPLHAQVGFRDGSLLTANSIKSLGNRLQLELPGGITLETYVDHPARLWDDFIFVAPANSRVVYLSDLSPIPSSFRHEPFLEAHWPYKSDQNLLGGRLRSGGNIVTKGLAMHSASRLAYSLDGKYERFEAELAIDDSAGDRGSVRYRVYLDKGTGGFQRAYESKVIRGGDRPEPISVDVIETQRMAIIVDFADYGDTMDHANWLRTRLLKPSP